MEEKIITLSTSHVRPETLNRVIEDDFMCLVCFVKCNDGKRVYGAFIRIPNVTEDGEMDDVPEDLRAVLDYAAGKGAVWVNLDVDADCVELPKYWG